MFANNIKYLRKKRNWTQTDLAKRLGYPTPATVSVWELQKSTPPYKKLHEIADLFHVDITDLMTKDLEAEEQNMIDNIENISVPASYGIKILGTICAGDGIDCNENYDGIFFVDNSIRADFCLNVKGDSMTDAGITEGNKAFMIKNCSYENGKIYAVLLPEDNNAILRKVYWQDGHIILKPCNENYKPLITTEQETQILGECVGIYRGL